MEVPLLALWIDEAAGAFAPWLVGHGLMLSFSPMTDVQITAKAALDQLMQGNARHVAGVGKAANPPEARAALAQGQAPVVALVCCADSRSVPEVIFDQPLGTIFTCAVAGNLVTNEVLGSLQYAVEVLQVPLLMVLGHSSCGAVTAAVQGGSLPGALGDVVGQIETGGQDEVPAAIDANVAAMVAKLQGAFDVETVGAVHDLAEGTVTVQG